MISTDLTEDGTPTFYKYVNFAIRGENTLDQVYTNIKQAFRAVHHPHLGNLDHLSVRLIPVYRNNLSVKQIRAWPRLRYLSSPGLF